MIYYTSFSFIRLFDRIVAEAGPSQHLIFAISKRDREENETNEKRNNHQRDTKTRSTDASTLSHCSCIINHSTRFADLVVIRSVSASHEACLTVFSNSKTQRRQETCIFFLFILFHCLTAGKIRLPVYLQRLYKTRAISATLKTLRQGMILLTLSVA